MSTDREIVITRTFSAPRDLVWAAFTEAGHVEKWWGPKGFTTRVDELDPVAGGKTSYVMMAPDGKEYPVGGVFREVDPPHRFVTTDEFGEGYEGDTIDGIVLTALFEEQEGATTLTLLLTHPNAESRQQHEDMGVVGGWHSSFDCLDDHLTTLTR